MFKYTAKYVHINFYLNIEYFIPGTKHNEKNGIGL